MITAYIWITLILNTILFWKAITEPPAEDKTARRIAAIVLFILVVMGIFSAATL